MTSSGESGSRLEACLIFKLYTLLRLLKAPVEEVSRSELHAVGIKMGSSVLRLPEHFQRLTLPLIDQERNPRSFSALHVAREVTSAAITNRGSDCLRAA